MKRVLATTGLMGALTMAAINVWKKMAGVSGRNGVKGALNVRG